MSDNNMNETFFVVHLLTKSPQLMRCIGDVVARPSINSFPQSWSFIRSFRNLNFVVNTYDPSRWTTIQKEN